MKSKFGWNRQANDDDDNDDDAAADRIGKQDTCKLNERNKSQSKRWNENKQAKQKFYIW